MLVLGLQIKTFKLNINYDLEVSIAGYIYNQDAEQDVICKNNTR